MEAGKVRTGEDIGAGWIDTTADSMERAKARLAELNDLLTASRKRYSRQAGCLKPCPMGPDGVVKFSPEENTQMPLVVLSFVLVLASNFFAALIAPTSSFAGIENARHFQERTIPLRARYYARSTKWSRGRLVGEPCGGFKNWRCAPGLDCERQRGTLGVCVRKKA
jgi:hypothetical protein